jgi:protein-tyrosine-phosphatase
MSNRAFIEANFNKLREVTQAAWDKKQDIEDPTDKQTEVMEALEQFLDTIEEAWNELEAAYDA